MESGFTYFFALTKKNVIVIYVGLFLSLSLA